MSTETTTIQPTTVHKMSAVLDGKEIDDLIIALEEILRLLNAGFTSGLNRNETGSFSFVIIEK